MGRKRTIHLNLPVHMKARVRSSGTYYYYFDGSKEIALGSDYLLAVRKWADLEGGSAAYKNVTDITFRFVAERYVQNELFKKAPRTQKDYLRDIENLYKFFDKPPVAIDKIEPHMIAQYRDWRKVTHSTQELAIFSAIWNWSREQGYTSKANPTVGIKRNRAKGRDAYITDEMFTAVYENADQPLRDAMDFAHLAGQRPADSLKFKETDIRDGALWVTQGKTGTKLRIQIVGELEQLILRIKARKSQIPKIRNLALIVNEKGQPLTYAALDARFGKARDAAGIEAKDFQFRDLRAKAATEVEDQSGMDAAQGLLGHANASMTNHYVRQRMGKLVQPTK